MESHGVGASLSGETDQDYRAAGGRRPTRFCGAHHGATAHDGTGPASDRGEPPRSGRHDRNRRRSQVARRRLHAAAGRTATLSISPSLYANPGYDPGTSFAPISLVATAPFLVVVHPSLPARSLKELIALAQAKPGELNFGSAGNGTPLHIAGEMLKAAAGVQMVHVPYRARQQRSSICFPAASR